jgi:uncharacterized protein YjiS (DUF1127 family)
MINTFHHRTTLDGMCQQTSHRPTTHGTGLNALWDIPGKIEGWSQRAQQRRALAELDDRFLKDVGISKAAAAAEASKPFWK